jgi:hypothetical protein
MQPYIQWLKKLFRVSYIRYIYGRNFAVFGQICTLPPPLVPVTYRVLHEHFLKINYKFYLTCQYHAVKVRGGRGSDIPLLLLRFFFRTTLSARHTLWCQMVRDWKGCEMKWLWPVWSYCPGICVEGVRKTNRPRIEPGLSQKVQTLDLRPGFWTLAFSGVRGQLAVL